MTDVGQALIQIGSEQAGMIAQIQSNGTFHSARVRYSDGWHVVEFRQDGYAGPKFKGIELRSSPDGQAIFEGEKDGVAYTLEYRAESNGLEIVATVANPTRRAFEPETLSLQLGIDTYIDKYPRWNTQFFPTFLRCEKTHFWGYLMTPKSRILGLSSPDPIASYTIEYEQRIYAHCIYTVALDLLHRPPLPKHHPSLPSLKPGERRVWRIHLGPIENFESIKPALANRCGAPLIELYPYTTEPGQRVIANILSQEPIVIEVEDESGQKSRAKAVAAGEHGYRAALPAVRKRGYYTVSVVSASGKHAEAIFYVRPPWSWYIKQGRQEALRQTPRADTSSIDGFSCESFYGLYGFFMARKYFPKAAIDRKGDRILQVVLDRLFQEKDGMIFSKNMERIANTSTLVSMLVDRYQATGEMADIEKAEKMAAFLLTRQTPKGFYGGYNFKHYTSVLYIAKAFVELMEVERSLIAGDPKWELLYQKHYDSVRRAMDELVERGLEISTEGESTFEDGATSCSATQLAMFALMQHDPSARQKYLDAARRLMDSHRCLTLLHAPDTRMRGGTLRFWELWAEIRMPRNMMQSPHGWSAWRIYGLYYLYLITGEESYLTQTMNALGSCAQLMKWPRGEIRCAFIPDPYVPAQVCEPSPDDVHGKLVPHILGESYAECIGQWFGGKGSTYLDRVKWEWVGGGTAYEVFKALEEVALTQSYVLERADGELQTWNCRVRQGVNGLLRIKPSEAIVTRVHVNLTRAQDVEVVFGRNRAVHRACQPGMQWINLDGSPVAGYAGLAITDAAPIKN